MSYNYKSGSISREVGGYPLESDDYGQWDLSAGYKVNDNFKLTLKAINVTDEEAYSTWTANGNTYPGSAQIYGRRVSLGLRGTF
jgi:iron complex outermembrane recepter protein